MVGRGLRGGHFSTTHTFIEFLVTRGWKTGDALFPEVFQNAALTQLKRLIAFIGTPNASVTTWKAVRAGRATAMAAAGSSLGEILCAGEWRSLAYLRYVNEEIADAGQGLRSTIQHELDEIDE